MSGVTPLTTVLFLLVVAMVAWQNHWRLRTASRGSIVQPVRLPGAAPAAGASPAPEAAARIAAALLPLTNFGAVSTTALLDAHGGGMSSDQKRTLVQAHQQLYCSTKPPDPPGSTRTTFSNVSILVYSDNDIVSNFLKGEMHSWEATEVKEMFYAMRAPVPTSPEDAKDPSKWRPSSPPFVLDIGANIGWFTLNAAAAGGRVAAFEAMGNNVLLVRSSLCANPWLNERVALYATGLGTKRSTCSIISDAANRGDGHTICDKARAAAPRRAPHPSAPPSHNASDVIKQWKAETDRDYVVRGEMSVSRLDSIIDHDVQYIKIDVEGFESQVLAGAEGLLRDHNVWFIAAECNVELIKAAGQAAFLKFLDAQGYYISSAGFQGPFLKAEDLAAGRPVTLAAITLYCVKKLLVDANGGPAYSLLTPFQRSQAARGVPGVEVIPAGGAAAAPLPRPATPEAAIAPIAPAAGAGPPRRRRRLLGGGGGGGEGGRRRAARWEARPAWAAWLEAAAGGPPAPAA
ncbi:MAG: S-adenosyl-L-methionine-dependent methyltransferase [Monoraphidium minutum]|nr:MAG: S-adenosyl-L-methionine-dependent methyltransferase [Monoraphidium minutum]